ncbi:MAG TPA: hypothetical protein VGM27_27685 [Acidobacteriaceae bacterium]
MMQRIRQRWLKQSLLLGLISLSISSSIGARGSTPPKHFVILPSKNLPMETQQPTAAALLYYASCDKTYLYLEQDGGRHLVVVDVTDPSRVRLKANVVVPGRGGFSFVEPLGRNEELIRFNDGSGDAVLLLSHAKKPEIVSLDQSGSETRLQPAESANPRLSYHPHPTDYVLIQAGNVNTTIRGITEKVMDTQSGATFLIGESGLTVVRDRFVQSNNLACQRYSSNYDAP